jgi:hypothetical protein
MRHGPHQGAQTSTTTGTEERATCFINIAPLASAGWPENSGCLHEPQRAFCAGRSAGSRFTAEQDGQTISFVSDMGLLRAGFARRKPSASRAGAD